ncbi:hypothetical protein RFF05_14740 [Bengtsoniella intestinalis]|nr:hypothetical protein [Chakrabartyella piscis]
MAGNARKEIEERTGKPVLTDKAAADFTGLISDIITANLSSGEDDEKS